MKLIIFRDCLWLEKGHYELGLCSLVIKLRQIYTLFLFMLISEVHFKMSTFHNLVHCF